MSLHAALNDVDPILRFLSKNISSGKQPMFGHGLRDSVSCQRNCHGQKR